MSHIRSQSSRVPKQSEDDARIIARCKAGDHAGFRELYIRYQKPIISFAMRIVRDIEIARDVFQEVFIRVMKHVGNFDGCVSLFTWLSAIARNLCIDLLRKNKYENKIEYEDSLTHNDIPGTVLSPTVPDPEQLAQQMERRQILETSMSDLKDAHRQVLKLSIEGMSYKEMYTILKCPPGTVMSRLFHARQALKESLCRRHEGGFDDV